MDPIKDLYISPNRKIYSHTEIDTDSDNTRERKRERERERERLKDLWFMHGH